MKIHSGVQYQMEKPTLMVLDGLYAIHRLAPDSPVPPALFEYGFYTISRTHDELSIVAPQSAQIESELVDSGWACMKVVGPLDLNITGVLAGISDVLAEVKISIFAISTYDTDYILVKERDIQKAQQALMEKGYRFRD